MTSLSGEADSAESREARLALAREAFVKYGARCFWYLRDDLEVTEETLPTIIEGLRDYGDRAAFQLAALLCR